MMVQTWLARLVYVGPLGTRSVAEQVRYRRRNSLARRASNAYATGEMRRVQEIHRSAPETH